MWIAVAAGNVYFALVLIAGFVLGTLRTLVLAPHLGDVAAVVVEIPAMLAIAWLACGVVIRRLRVPDEWTARLAMGGIAFSLLMAAEMVLAWILFARPPAEHFASYARPDALLGLAAQIAFGLFPLARLRGAGSARVSGS
jgi:hypothetical protein